MKLPTAVISKPLICSFICIAMISALSGSIRFEDRYHLWLAGADSRHQQRLEQMVAELRNNQVVSSFNECGCGTVAMQLHSELYEYVKRGELTEGQASNYCPYRELEMVAYENIRT